MWQFVCTIGTCKLLVNTFGEITKLMHIHKRSYSIIIWYPVIWESSEIKSLPLISQIWPEVNSHNEKNYIATSSKLLFLCTHQEQNNTDKFRVIFYSSCFIRIWLSLHISDIQKKKFFKAINSPIKQKKFNHKVIIKVREMKFLSQKLLTEKTYESLGLSLSISTQWFNHY